MIELKFATPGIVVKSGLGTTLKESDPTFKQL